MPVGVEVTLGSGAVVRLDASDYTVEEDANPLDPSDSTGGFGQITVGLTDDAEIPTSLNKTLTLVDGSMGTTQGQIRTVKGNGLSATVTANSRLGLLAVERTIAPFIGTLTAGITYLLGLCGISTGIVIDTSFNSVNVKLPGGRENVYDRLMDMGAAYNFEVSLVSNNVVVRIPRQRTAINYRDASIDWALDQNNLARSVQAYYYNSTSGTAIAYPVLQDVEGAQVYQVDANETQVFEIPLSCSLSAVTQPTCQTSVSYNDMSASQYCVAGSDETLISPTVWNGNGGKVTATIGDDTKTLIITIIGANLPDQGPFRIAMPTGDNQYFSSLRIHGTGVFWDKKLFTFQNGNPQDLAPDEIGVIVDSPYLETFDIMYKRILKTAERYSSDTQTISVTSGGINRLGETGSARYPTIADVAAAYPGATITSIQASLGPKISDWNATLYAMVQSDFTNQAFGNVAGARVKYGKSWYRIRTATLRPRAITYGAERDNTIADVYTTGETITQWNARWSGKTIRDVNIAPLIS